MNEEEIRADERKKMMTNIRENIDQHGATITCPFCFKEMSIVVFHEGSGL